MKRRVDVVWLVVAASVLVSIGVGSVRADEATDEVVTMTRRYIEHLRAGNITDKAAKVWDVERLMSSGFGLIYLELSEAEQKRARDAFVAFLDAPFQSKPLQQLFKSIRVEEIAATRLAGDKISVRFTTVGDEGRFRKESRMLYEKSEAGWRITDMRQEGQPSMRSALVMMYLGSEPGPDDTIGSVIEQIAAQVLRHAQSQ